MLKFGLVPTNKHSIKYSGDVKNLRFLQGTRQPQNHWLNHPLKIGK